MYLSSRKSVEKAIPVFKNFNKNSKVLYPTIYSTLPLGSLIGIVDLTYPKKTWFSADPSITCNKCFDCHQKLNISALPMLPERKWHLWLPNSQSQVPVNISDSSLSLLIHIQSISKAVDNFLHYFISRLWLSLYDFPCSLLFVPRTLATLTFSLFLEFDKPLLASKTLYHCFFDLDDCHIIT